MRTRKTRPEIISQPRQWQTVAHRPNLAHCLFFGNKVSLEENHSHSLSSVAAFTLFADLSSYNPQSPKYLLSGPWQKKFANPCPNPSHSLSKYTDPSPIRLFTPTKHFLSIYLLYTRHCSKDIAGKKKKKRKKIKSCCSKVKKP